jgi:hypothetical protein
VHASTSITHYVGWSVRPLVGLLVCPHITLSAFFLIQKFDVFCLWNRDILWSNLEALITIDYMSGNGHRYPDAPSPGSSGMGWWGIGSQRGQCPMFSPPGHPSIKGNPPSYLELLRHAPGLDYPCFSN